MKEYVDEMRRRWEFRDEMRKRNREPGAERLDEDALRKLDSSLKKNSAFVRKIRNFSEPQKRALVDEALTLNLTKYLSEVTNAMVAEVKLKVSDVPAAVELCSLLHRRYADFAHNLLEAWSKAFTAPTSSSAQPVSGSGGVVMASKGPSINLNTANLSKLRVDLKFYADLVSCCVFPVKEGLSLLGNVLKSLISGDKEDHANISVVLTFCKGCGDDFAGLVSRRMLDTASALPDQGPAQILAMAKDNSLLPQDKQRNVRQLLKEYFESVAAHLVRLKRSVIGLERRNRQILLTKGDLGQEKRKQLANEQLAFDKLKESAEALADLLGEDMPPMPAFDSSADAGLDDGLDPTDLMSADLLAGARNAEDDRTDDSLWEDEDTQSFYENLVDLRAIVPGILCQDPASNRKDSSSSKEPADAASATTGATSTAGTTENFDQDMDLDLEAVMAYEEATATETFDNEDMEEPEALGTWSTNLETRQVKYKCNLIMKFKFDYLQ